jgi:hypothetical protein
MILQQKITKIWGKPENGRNVTFVDEKKPEIKP